MEVTADAAPAVREEKFLVIMVDSAVSYVARRKAIRQSWLRYLTDSTIAQLSEEQKKRFHLRRKNRTVFLFVLLIPF